MRLNFQHWLEYEENVELSVAKFLEDILDKAANLKKQDLHGQKDFSQYIKHVWPPDAIQGGNFILPSNFPQGIAGQPIQFRLTSSDKRAETIHDQGQFKGFIFNINPLNQAQTPNDVDQAIDALKLAIHHEAEHIFNIGSRSGTQDSQQHALTYLNNPGEIRAHAREIAYAYAKNFPGQKFDLNKAQSLLNKPGFNTTHKNYLANPNVPNQKLLSLIPQFLNQYQLT